VEPPGDLDHAAIAAAAVATLGFEEALAVVVDWHEGLTPEQRVAAQIRLYGTR
jgi:hypothetical protein